MTGRLNTGMRDKPRSGRSLFEELANIDMANTETRAENAYGVGVKFLDLLRTECSDDKSFELMMKAWLRAVKDGDFSKFQRVYRKHKK